MRATYYPGDDILVLRFNDREIVREVSQDWHINVAFDADGTVVRMVILEAVQVYGSFRALVLKDVLSRGVPATRRGNAIDLDNNGSITGPALQRRPVC